MLAFRKYSIKIAAFILMCCLCHLLFQSCRRTKPVQEEQEHISDLALIRQNGRLRAVVDYNSTNYFVYRGRPMGFKYELLNKLCEELDVKLEVIVSNSLDDSFEGLKTGRYDVVAQNLAITLSRKNEVDFTVPLYQTNQVLVQREVGPKNPDSMYVYSVLGLSGKTVYVQRNSSFHKRLLHLTEEIGGHIEIMEDTIYGTEDLVARVARGEIDYTICDENIGRLNKTYYPNLDVSLDISFPQNIAWAVRKDSGEWRTYLNNWITEFKETREYQRMYYRYFRNPRIVRRLQSDYHSISGGKISAYDDVIKQMAKENNWDWRLIASIIYHESRFNPEAESWAGAYGLMQLMPETARALGIEDYKDPVQNIKGGIYMLNWLNERLMESVPDSTERVKFVLASYNVGLGHVKDAQRLAKKYGKNSQVWDDNVDFFLKNKSAEKYFKDPVVRWGYCRGDQPYNYVNKVTYNYMHYLNVISEL